LLSYFFLFSHFLHHVRVGITQNIISELSALQQGFTKDYQDGYLQESYKLRITRPGCEFDGIMGGFNSLLPEWFKHADISGYGNVQTQETAVDETVRSAREIPATEFSVGRKMLREIEDIWSRFFIPPKVRAEPYKIHLYGPGGHFRSHLDTPEKGLVGTFLIGLADTTTPRNRFKIGTDTYSAGLHKYVAFYPDVAHEVLKIDDGYRGVIAFKLFRADSSQLDDSVDRYSETVAHLDVVLKKLKPPFGIHLSHQYEKSMTDPSGFDKILVEAARRLPGTVVRIIPVLRSQGADVNEEEYEYNEAYANVYPLTDAHLDFLLGDKEALNRDLTSAWMNEFTAIPFIEPLHTSSTQWSTTYNEGPGYTGNESRAHDEHAVYMSYAVVVLPADRMVEIEANAVKKLQGNGSHTEGGTSQKRRRVDSESKEDGGDLGVDAPGDIEAPRTV